MEATTATSTPTAMLSLLVAAIRSNAPNYAALRLWKSLQQVCHEAGHGKKRCLATGNPARAEESLNLGLNYQAAEIEGFIPLAE